MSGINKYKIDNLPYLKKHIDNNNYLSIDSLKKTLQSLEIYIDKKMFEEKKKIFDALEKITQPSNITNKSVLEEDVSKKMHNNDGNYQTLISDIYKIAKDYSTSKFYVIALAVKELERNIDLSLDLDFKGVDFEKEILNHFKNRGVQGERIIIPELSQG